MTERRKAASRESQWWLLGTSPPLRSTSASLKYLQPPDGIGSSPTVSVLTKAHTTSGEPWVHAAAFTSRTQFHFLARRCGYGSCTPICPDWGTARAASARRSSQPRPVGHLPRTPCRVFSESLNHNPYWSMPKTTSMRIGNTRANSTAAAPLAYTPSSRSRVTGFSWVHASGGGAGGPCASVTQARDLSVMQLPSFLPDVWTTDSPQRPAAPSRPQPARRYGLLV